VAQINTARREIHLKLVYCGPGLSGKTTNLRWLHRTLPDSGKGRLISLATKDERTLFFDFLPFEIPNVAGFKVRISLYTAPGQSVYRSSQGLILNDVDGIVFVADSHPYRMAANRASFDSLNQTLEAAGGSLTELPHIFQYNKRDLPNRVPLEDLERALNPDGVAFVPAIATRGRGVSDVLKDLTRQALKQVLGGSKKGSR